MDCAALGFASLGYAQLRFAGLRSAKLCKSWLVIKWGPVLRLARLCLARLCFDLLGLASLCKSWLVYSSPLPPHRHRRPYIALPTPPAMVRHAKPANVAWPVAPRHAARFPLAHSRSWRLRAGQSPFRSSAGCSNSRILSRTCRSSAQV